MKSGKWELWPECGPAAGGGLAWLPAGRGRVGRGCGENALLAAAGGILEAAHEAIS